MTMSATRPRQATLLAALKRRKALLVTLGALSALSGAVPIAALNLHVLHRAAPHMQPPLIKRDPSGSPRSPRAVALVLGARVMPSGQPSPALQERLALALALYQRGEVARILVTGDHREHHYDEVRAMFRWLHARGVPREHIFLDHAGFRTWDSMQRARHVFQVRDVIICTQAFHLARAVYLARHAGLDAVGVPTDGDLYHPSPRMHARELLARAWAVLDARVLKTPPAHLGPAIPIDGPSAPSYDF